MQQRRMRDQVPEDRGLHCLAVAGTPGFVEDLMYLLLASPLGGISS